MTTSGSVSEWIEALKTGDASAATHLWNRFHRSLMRFARRRLHDEARRVTDEEDVVSHAFGSFFCRVMDGQFPELSGREQLWALLVTITDRKVVNTVRQNMAWKRGGGRVRGESTCSDAEKEENGILGVSKTTACSPVVAACLTELMESLDEDMRQVVRLRIAGLTNEQIGQRLNRSLATIERRLRLLRAQWYEELFG